MVLGILPGELTLQFILYPLYSVRINSHTCKRRKKPPPPVIILEGVQEDTLRPHPTHQKIHRVQKSP